MRDDFDPARRNADLAREGLALAALGALYGFGYLRPRQPRAHGRDARTVVFLHGLLANRSTLYPLQGYLRLRGHGRQYSFNYRLRGTVEAMALDLKRHLDRSVRGGRIDLVGHSLGGLVARTYVQMLGGHRRVDRLVTLATPHRGSYPSSFIPTRLLAQLRPGGPFLEYLNGLPAPRGVRTTSIVVGRDLLVMPADSAAAPFGDVVRFDDVGHLDMLFSPRVLRSVHRALRAPAGAPRALGSGTWERVAGTIG